MRLHQFITESRKPFRLHPGLNPEDYQITDNMRDVARWRCRIFAGDERDGQNKVGYVMISLKDDTIVPIARGDEHHRGMDLMYDFQNGYKKGGFRIDKVEGLRASDYIPIWAHGQNYIYDPREIPNLLIAVRKFLSYGGIDGVLIGANQMSGKIVKLSTFVSLNGNLEIKAGTLAPIGQKIYDDMKKLADILRSIPIDADRITARPAFVQAAKILKEMPASIIYKLGIDYDDFKELPAKLRALQKDNDYKGLEELFFAYHGVKNKMHTFMKDNKDNMWHDRELKGIWGDVDLAIDMLGRF